MRIRGKTIATTALLATTMACAPATEEAAPIKAEPITAEVHAEEIQ